MFCLPAVAKPGKTPKLKLATRGYSPENVEGDADDHFSKVVDDLMVKIPEAWGRVARFEACAVARRSPRSDHGRRSHERFLRT
jgi:hypothetical protein